MVKGSPVYSKHPQSVDHAKSCACPVMLARPWGFDLADVNAYVELWHGTDDANVPIAIGRAMAERLPDCTAHIVEGAGHTVAWTKLDEIMRAIAAAT